MEWDVTGLGNALMDALVIVDDDAVLEDLGLVRGTMHPVDHARWTEVYERVRGHGVVFDSGGSCANTVATVGRLGGRAIYCGQVGDDQMGHLYASHVERACGGHRLRFTRAAPTGKCLSIISRRDAERTMLTDLGAATLLPDLGRFAEELRRARICHFTGYTILDGPMRQVALEGMQIASDAGARVSFDCADPFVCLQQRELLWTVIERFASVVFLNRDEARALTDLEDPEAGAIAVSRRGEVPLVAVKLGARGSLVVHEGEVYRVQAELVQAVDTTGAGDAYAGGFLYGLARGWDAPDCGRLGSAVAALAVAQVGAVVKDMDALRRAIERVRPAA